MYRTAGKTFSCKKIFLKFWENDSDDDDEVGVEEGWKIVGG